MDVNERARQFSGEEVITRKFNKQLLKKYWVDAKRLESLNNLDFTSNVTFYDALSNNQLRKNLTNKAKELKDVVIIGGLDKLVEDELPVDMTDKVARFRFETLFVFYRFLLCRNGLTWFTQENEKIAVYHVFSAICPESLRVHLESDLELSHYELRKDFKGFMYHAIKLSEAFQLVKNGAPTKRHKDRDSLNRHNQGDQPGHDKGKRKGKDGNTGNNGNGQKPPVCLHALNKAKGYCHYLKDFVARLDEEKRPSSNAW